MSTTSPSLPGASAATPPVLPGAQVARTKNWPWYKSSTDFRLTPTGRQIFEEYSHIAPADIEPHIFHIRELAWKVFPWPCVGQFWFVSFGLSLHPKYAKLLSKLRGPSSTPPKLLDLGTCLGQDLRKLHFDGIPVESLYGSDIFPAYEAVGDALFRDKGTFAGHFIATDLFDESKENVLVKTQGSWDVIVAIMFLHVFDRTEQVKACGRMLDLLSSKPGSMIIGAQTATIKPGEQVVVPPFVQPGEHKTVYRQSRETFTQMWESVGQAKGVELKIWTEYEAIESKGAGDEKEQKYFTGNEERRLFFLVERI